MITRRWRTVAAGALAAVLAASASDAGERPPERFTSKRAPLAYEPAWRAKHQPGRYYQHVAAGPGGAFYALLSQAGGAPAVEIFNPGGKSRLVPIAEKKARRTASIVVESEGSLLLWDSSIAFGFDTGGKYLGQIVAMSPKLTSASRRLALSPAGNLLVADGGPRIMEFSRLGHPVRTVLLRGSPAKGLAVSPDGLAYVGLTGSGQIAVLNGGLKELGRFGGHGEVPGRFLEVGPLAVSARMLVVFDRMSRRVKFLDRNGVELLAVGPGWATSIAVSPDDMVLAHGRKGLSCFRRVQVGGPKAAGHFSDYVKALALADRGKVKEAAGAFAALAASEDAPPDIRAAAANAARGVNFASARHYRAPAQIPPVEARALLERRGMRPASSAAADTVDGDLTWVALEQSFCASVDRFERVVRFDEFPETHGLEDRLRPRPSLGGHRPRPGLVRQEGPLLALPRGGGQGRLAADRVARALRRGPAQGEDPRGRRRHPGR